MGHQTLVKTCDKCKGTIITTKIFNRTIKSSNCKCMEKVKNGKKNKIGMV